MQQLLFGVCNREGGPGSFSEQDLVHRKYAAPSPLSARQSGELSQAWAQLLCSFEDESTKSVFIGSEDVPPDLQPEHRDVLRGVLERRVAGLESVTIGDVPSESSRLLAEALHSTRNLGELKFTGTRSDDALAKLMGTLLRPVWVKHPSLRCLVISNHIRNMLTDKGAVTIAQALEENMCLQTLVLFGTLMGDGAARAIASAMEQNTKSQLQVLVFYGKALTGKGTAAIGRWIKAENFGLKELVIGGSEFGDEDGQALVREVVDRKRVDTSLPLQSFGMLNVNLGDALVPCLSALATCGLREVSIVAGRLSDEGATHVTRRAFGIKQRKATLIITEDCIEAEPAQRDMEPLSVFRLATSSAGDQAIKAITRAWSEGNMPGACELAFGSASVEVCEEIMQEINASDAMERLCALRSAASSSATSAAAAGGTNPGQGPSETGCGWLFSGTHSRRRLSGEEDGETSQAMRLRMLATCNLPSYLEEVLFPQLMLRDNSLASAKANM